MQALRDNPDCAQEEFDQITEEGDPGLSMKLSFDLSDHPARLLINHGVKPKVAILREQGINGHVEMAAAFDRAGFACQDVHMSDVLEERVDLGAFVGLAVCGGFSYGDVFGAGLGWAKTILFNPRAYDQFSSFFMNPRTFTLGVCNGCQMLSQLKNLIPGADHWPHFVRNASEQFEARLARVEILESPSLFFKDMQGSQIPIVVSHGEGRVQFENELDATKVQAFNLTALRYVDNQGGATERYPANPNGSPGGITGLTTRDGRVTIVMPHPERVFRNVQFSWAPDGLGEDSPWMRMFYNARAWV
jgi:phosphoribosylformylglycinamidine synthase